MKKVENHCARVTPRRRNAITLIMDSNVPSFRTWILSIRPQVYLFLVFGWVDSLALIKESTQTHNTNNRYCDQKTEGTSYNTSVLRNDTGKQAS